MEGRKIAMVMVNATQIRNQVRQSAAVSLGSLMMDLIYAANAKIISSHSLIACRDSGL
jgi:hypothetical protein